MLSSCTKIRPWAPVISSVQCRGGSGFSYSSCRQVLGNIHETGWNEMPICYSTWKRNSNHKTPKWHTLLINGLFNQSPIIPPTAIHLMPRPLPTLEAATPWRNFQAQSLNSVDVFAAMSSFWAPSFNLTVSFCLLKNLDHGRICLPLAEKQ